MRLTLSDSHRRHCYRYIDSLSIQFNHIFVCAFDREVMAEYQALRLVRLMKEQRKNKHQIRLAVRHVAHYEANHW